MKIARKLLLVLALFSTTVSAPLRAVDVNPVSLGNFQIAWMGAWTVGSNAFFGQFSWTPYVALGPVGLRGEVGVSSLQFTGSRFLVTNYEALLHLPLFPGLSVEGGGGVHIWHRQSPAALALTANVLIGSPLGLDRVFVGFTRYTGGFGANEFRLGIGFEI